MQDLVGRNRRFEELRQRALASVATATNEPGPEALDDVRLDVNRFLRWHRKLQDDPAPTAEPGQFNHAVHIFHTLLWERPDAPSIPVLLAQLGQVLSVLPAPEAQAVDLVGS